MHAKLGIVGVDSYYDLRLGDRLTDQTLPPQVRGVLFDMGDVLYDASMWRRWLLQLLQRFGMHTNYRSFYRVWEQEYAESVYCGRTDYWDTLGEFLLSAGLSTAQFDELAAAARSRCRELQASGRPLPGVRSTLTDLAGQGIALAGIANSSETGVQLKQRLVDLQINRQIATATSSRDIGCTMPAEAAYQAGLQALGLSAEEVAFVGHDTIELQGAQELGMTTIAVNYDLDAVANIYLDRFEELAELFVQPALAQAV